MLPPHIITALQKWALVTKEKMASPFDHDTTLPQYWSEHPRDKAFGANCNAFSSKFTGYSICRHIYHDFFFGGGCYTVLSKGLTE